MAINKIVHGRGHSYEMTAKIDGKVVRRRFPTKKAAADEYARLRQAALHGTYTPAARERLTLDTYVRQHWLPGLQVEDSTRAAYACYYGRHIAPLLGGRPIRAIERLEVQRLVTVLQSKGLAARTVKAIYNIVAMVMRNCVYDEIRPSSPCRKIALPPILRTDLSIFTPAQARTLLATATGRDRAVLATSIATGMRQGEILGLTEDHVRLNALEVVVSQQLKTPVGAGRPYLSPKLKTDASRRVVPLPVFARDILQAHLDEFGTGEHGLLFVNRRGLAWRRGGFNTAVWKPALQRAGLDRSLGMHAARHLYASLLIAEGQHPRVIQARLGHASIVETMDTYGHLFPEAGQASADALDRFAAVQDPPGEAATGATA